MKNKLKSIITLLILTIILIPTISASWTAEGLTYLVIATMAFVIINGWCATVL